MGLAGLKGADRLMRDLRTGLLVVDILWILIERGPLHGYGVRKALESITGEVPPESTVYDALKRLERLGLAESYWVRSDRGSPRKYYKPTVNAGEVLQLLISEAKRLLSSLICR